MKYSLGPCTFEWVDGEFRYLKVNDQEIIRRIYFTVRYAEWNTAIGRVLSTNVTSQAAGEIVISSRVLFEAPGITYAAEIGLTFNASGKLTYEVEGTTEQDSSSFDIRRAGICVLLGAREYASLPFELQSRTEANYKGSFTDLIEPEVRLPVYNSLLTASPAGGKLHIRIKNDSFGLEDQRTFNDNSWKLFSGLPHSYPDLLKEDIASETIQISFETSWPSTPSSFSQHDLLHLAQGAELLLPNSISAKSLTPNQFFSTSEINESTTVLSWGFTPLVNLDDEATIWENVSTVLDQARTAQASLRGHKAILKIDPISLRPLAERAKGSSHASSALAGPFVVSMIKHLAMAGINEASFSSLSEQAEEILHNLSTRAGKRITPVRFAIEQPLDIDGFIFKDDSMWEVWIANRSKIWRSLPIDMKFMDILNIERVNALGQWETGEHVRQGDLNMLTVQPYDVLRLRIRPSEKWI